MKEAYSNKSHDSSINRAIVKARYSLIHFPTSALIQYIFQLTINFKKDSKPVYRVFALIKVEFIKMRENLSHIFFAFDSLSFTVKI